MRSARMGLRLLQIASHLRTSPRQARRSHRTLRPRDHRLVAEPTTALGTRPPPRAPPLHHHRASQPRRRTSSTYPRSMPSFTKPPSSQQLPPLLGCQPPPPLLIRRHRCTTIAIHLLTVTLLLTRHPMRRPLLLPRERAPPRSSRSRSRGPDCGARQLVRSTRHHILIDRRRPTITINTTMAPRGMRRPLLRLEPLWKRSGVEKNRWEASPDCPLAA
mmetsp:Transcript_13536/g.40812  ORF Transcript_13536/g.40812 Transcript_13536/m.40812 type:complete len:217 (-) Transcript_13536:42-692(-)